MTATGARPLDGLPAESKAMLSLLLVRGRSFQEIADMLHMPPVDVRERAHTAAELLAGDDDHQTPSPAGRARIIDYLLGEQSVSERELTRLELSSLEVSREWASRLSARLAAIAKHPLPSIPGPVPVEEPPQPAIERAARPLQIQTPPPPAPPPAARPRPIRPPPAPPPVAPPPVAPQPAFRTRRPEPPPLPAPINPPAPPRRRRSARAPVIAVIALVAIVVAIVAIAGSGGSSPTRSTPAKTVHRLALVGSASSQNASGAGAVTAHHGRLLLVLQARGLAPNDHDFYGVWLYNAPSDARLLGFVSPPVGADGTFSSRVSLPGNAAHFHAVIITRETTDLPRTPGPTVLRGPLSLP